MTSKKDAEMADMRPTGAKRRPRLRVLAIMEATTVTGPAKPLLSFCRRNGTDVQLSIATFERRPDAPVLKRHVAGGEEFPNDFVAAACAAGADVYVIGERARFDRRVLGTLQQVMRACEPDLFETHNVKSHFLAKWAGLHRHRPWIALQHGYTSTDLKQQAYNQLDRWSLRSADRVVTVCRGFTSQLARYGIPAAKMLSLYNSLDLPPLPASEHVESVRRAARIDTDTRVVLSVGRLSREKRHIVLLEAFAHLLRHHAVANCKCLIVGDGPERPALRQAAARLGIVDHVHFAGQQQDTAPFYALADVMVLPSDSEGSPLALLEAMGAGVPVVATSVGGIPEHVQHEQSALLVPPRDPRRLAEQIARLLSDKPLAERLAGRARQILLTRFTSSVYDAARLSLYHDLLADYAHKE